MRISLPVHVATTIFAILALAISMTGVLGYYKYKSFQADLFRDRLALVLGDIRYTVEAFLALGLPLDQLPDVNRAMRDRVNQDARILSIELFDEDGVILYSVDESLRGDLVAEEWGAHRVQEGESVWVRLEPDAIAVGLEVQDIAGRPVGTVALRYVREIFDSQTRAMALSIAALCGGVLVIFAVLGAGLAYIFIRGPRDELRGMSSSISSNSPVPEAEKVPEPGVTGAPEPALALRFARAVQSAEESIDDAERQLREMEIGAYADSVKQGNP